MDEEEIKEVSQVMSRSWLSLLQCDRKTLLVDFVGQMSGTGSIMGSYGDPTERLLARILPGDKVGGIMEEIRGPASGRTMWDKLANVNETVLAGAYSEERVSANSVGGAVQERSSLSMPPVSWPPCPRNFPWKWCSACCAWKACSEGYSWTRSSRHCVSNSCPTWPVPPSGDSHEHMAEIFNNFDRPDRKPLYPPLWRNVHAIVPSASRH